MWWIRTRPEGDDRGGFQNRDVGRSQFNNDFGPDYGVDFARYSDPPNLALDHRLSENVLQYLDEKFPGAIQNLDLKIKNGFVLISCDVDDPRTKEEILQGLRAMEGVKEVIYRFQTDRQ